jgi:Holliday junction resolvase RusA-like endonuclease
MECKGLKNLCAGAMTDNLGPASSYTFEVELPPKTKARPRLGRGGRAYNPASTVEAEAAIAALYQGPSYGKSPLLLMVDYYGTHQVITLTPHAGTSKMRGDLDNYLKLTSDALEKAGAFDNDRCIIEIWAEKH